MAFAYEVANTAQVGDEIGVSGAYSYQDPIIVKVLRRTKTQIVTTGSIPGGTLQFNSRGYQIHTTAYRPLHLVSKQDVLDSRVALANKREKNRLMQKLSEQMWSNYTTEQLQQMLILVGTFKKEE